MLCIQDLYRYWRTHTLPCVYRTLQCTSTLISPFPRPLFLLHLWFWIHTALREVHNKLRLEVNKLQEENDVLNSQVTELQTQADKVDHIEQNLSYIVKDQGTSVAAFVDLVKQNGILQDEIEKKLMTEIMQNLLTTVIRSDLDRNFEISEDELNFLMVRLQGLPSVETIDEAAFRQMIADNGSGIHAIVKVCQNLSGQGQTGRAPLIKVSSRHLTL